ncbi:hypothetical protein LCGC14_2456130, partial [marine sediment metagenome]
RQAPGAVIRTPVRSAVVRDAAGRSTRTLYAGEVDTGGIERDMRDQAEYDGLDLSTAQMEITEEHGQGVGKRGNHKNPSRLPKPRYPKGRAIPKE